MAFIGDILYLYLGRNCNSNCYFCVVEGKKEQTLSLPKIFEKLETARDKNIVDLVLSGGESTIRTDIIEIIKFANSIGYINIQLQTNGRKLSQMAFTDEIISSGVTEFSISIHGDIAEIHDRITRIPGSFDETISGINNINKITNYNNIILTNSVLVKDNFYRISKLPKLLKSLNVCSIQFSYVHGQGRARNIFEKITPRMTYAKQFIIDIIENSLKSKYEIGEIMIEAVPFCILRGYEIFCSDLYIPKALVRDDMQEKLHYFDMEMARAKNYLCKECNFNNYCFGPWKEYPQLWGWEEFLPIKNLSPKDIIPEFVKLK